MFQGIEDSPVGERIKESHQEYVGTYSHERSP